MISPSCYSSSSSSSSSKTQDPLTSSRELWATYSRAVPVLRQLMWLALRHIHTRPTHLQQSRCVHMLLQLISVAATHIHDEGQDVPGFSCFEPQYPFTVSANQVVEQASDTRHFAAELLLKCCVPIAHHASDVDKVSCSNSGFARRC